MCCCKSSAGTLVQGFTCICVIRVALQALSAKQGRSSQFRSQDERDAHLKQTITRLKQAAAGQQELLKQLQQQESDISNSLNDMAAVSCSFMPAAQVAPGSIWVVFQCYLAAAGTKSRIMVDD